MLSVVIVTHPRSAFIIACIKSIASAADEIVVVIDGAPAPVADALEDLKRSIPSIRTVELQRPCKGAARNAGCAAAAGDIIYFLDDDVIAPPAALNAAREKFQLYPDVDVIGGPNLTPPDCARFQKTVGMILSSPLVSFSMARRYAVAGKDQYCSDRHLILCNMGVRRSVFSGGKYRFDERLHYNEENLLLWQLARDGRRMMYCPDLAVYHARRAALLPFARQVFGSGKGRAVMSVIAPASLSTVYLMPALLVLYVIFAAIIPAPARLAPLIGYGLYAAAAALSARGAGERLLALLLIPVAHGAYGAGFIAGIMSGKWKKKK